MNKNKDKILIIDDEPIIRTAVIDALSSENLEIIESDNGKDGIIKIKKYSPIVIITDIKMPIMDGMELLESLAVSPTDPYSIIVLTGHGENKEIKRCFDLGATAFIEKPFNIYNLIGLIREHIARKKVQKQLRNQTQHLDQIVKEKVSIIEEKNDQLRQSQKLELVGQLAGGIAHDFNNILTSIIGFSDLARTHINEDIIIKDYLSSIINKSEQAAALVQQLMAFSRQQKLKLNCINLDQLISRSIDFINKTIPENIKLTYKELNENINIEADSNAIQQIITNIIFNSIYAIGASNGKIDISCKKLNTQDKNKLTGISFNESEYVSIEIKDNGIGMNDKTIKKVFEPFFTTKPIGQGSGLGLSMVYGLIEQHNAFIDVRSKKRNGTSFYLYFPVSEKEIAKDSIVVGKVVNGNNHKILIVDDDLDLLGVLKAIFDNIGYKAIVSNNASDALEIVHKEKNNISLVMSDVVMPEMNGIKLVEKINKMNLNIKCILMSGYPDKIFKKEEYSIEKIPFLRKPFTLEQASALIMRILK